MPGFDMIPYNDLAALEAKLASNPDEYCAYFVCPLLPSIYDKYDVF